MTRYSAEELERQFRNAGRARQGNKKFANDAGYWSGGACDWGGCHNLKNDCETLAKAFNQMENLREIKKDLQKCTSSQEYEAKKSNYIRKCEGILDGLKTKTNSNSSIFNVCIIWQDEAMDKHVISKLKSFTTPLTNPSRGPIYIFLPTACCGDHPNCFAADSFKIKWYRFLSGPLSFDKSFISLMAADNANLISSTVKSNISFSYKLNKYEL